MTQVKMPEPVILRTVMPDDYRYGHVYGFTRRQMEAYAAAKVREALEEAATTCTNSLMMATDSYCGATAHYCADRIRALIPPLPGPVEP